MAMLIDGGTSQFRVGHALPLVKQGFCFHEFIALPPGNSQIYGSPVTAAWQIRDCECANDRPQSRNIRVRAKSTVAVSPDSQTRQRPVRVRNQGTNSNGLGRDKATDTNSSRPVLGSGDDTVTALPQCGICREPGQATNSPSPNLTAAIQRSLVARFISARYQQLSSVDPATILEGPKGCRSLTFNESGSGHWLREKNRDEPPF
jgi:hypothetical protein